MLVLAGLVADASALLMLVVLFFGAISEPKRGVFSSAIVMVNFSGLEYLAFQVEEKKGNKV